MSLPLVALVMPPLEAAAILLPILILQDINAVWVYRYGWHGRVLAVVCPGAAIGVGVAWLLAAYITDAEVRIFIGAITIVFLLYMALASYRIPREVEEPGAAQGIFWGALSGFTSTIGQAGSPPYQIYALQLKLPKMAYVSTTTIFFAVLNWLKVVPYFMLGTFSTKGLATSVVLMPFALLTNALGFWLVRRTPEKLFYRILCVLMFLLALELLRSGISGFLRGH
jgi:uncharacterized membrane protein YfcA